MIYLLRRIFASLIPTVAISCHLPESICSSFTTNVVIVVTKSADVNGPAYHSRSDTFYFLLGDVCYGPSKDNPWPLTLSWHGQEYGIKQPYTSRQGMPPVWLVSIFSQSGLSLEQKKNISRRVHRAHRVLGPKHKTCLLCGLCGLKRPEGAGEMCLFFYRSQFRTASILL